MTMHMRILVRNPVQIIDSYYLKSLTCGSGRASFNRSSMRSGFQRGSSGCLTSSFHFGDYDLGCCIFSGCFGGSCFLTG